MADVDLEGVWGGGCEFYGAALAGCVHGGGGGGDLGSFCGWGLLDT